MLILLLAMQTIATINQTGGITAGSVGNVTIAGNGETLVERVDHFRCPDGNFPKIKNLHYTNCSPEFSTVAEKRDYLNKPSNLILRRPTSKK